MTNFLMMMPLTMLLPVTAMTFSSSHFLLCLLNLEAMTLSSLILTFILMFKSSYLESLSTLILLSLGACEASMGLACLVKMTRSHGNDNIKSLNINYL